MGKFGTKKSDTRKYDIIVAVLLTIMGISIVVFGAKKYQFMIDGKTVKCDSITREGVVYVPLKVLVNELGVDIEFEKDLIKLDTSMSSRLDKYISESMVLDKKIYDEVYEVIGNKLSVSEIKLIKTQEVD